MLKPLFLASLTLIASCSTSTPAKSDDLKARLLAIAEKDQAAVSDPDESTEAVLRAHVSELRGIIAVHGWPRISVVGQEAAQAAWLVAQHADFDRAFQREALAMMEPLSMQSEVEPKYVGYLKDRIAVGDGLPQTYGTQGDCVGTRWEPHPIAEPESVDARRLSLSMQPLETYKAIGSSLFCSAQGE